MGKGAPFEPCLLLSTADALPSAATVVFVRVHVANPAGGKKAAGDLLRLSLIHI